MNLRILAILTVTLLLPVRAWADDTAAKAEAKQLNAQAEAAKNRGDYLAALADFQRAYRAFPSPNIRYNIAIVLVKLGRDAEAADEYEAFLAGAPDARADVRAKAVGQIAELDKRVAKLTITSHETNATVTVDAKPVGETPLARPARVMPGSHVVLVAKAGFQTNVSNVSVGAGESRTIGAELVRTTEAAATVAEAAPQQTFSSTHPEIRTTAKVPSLLKRHRIATWAVGGAGLGLLVGSLAAGLVANARYGDLKKGCAADGACDVNTLPNAQSLIDSGHAAGIASDALLGVGLAAVAVGVALFFVEGRHPAERRVWRISPSAGGVGFAWGMP